MATTEDKIDQQRRIIEQAQKNVRSLRLALSAVRESADEYVALGLGDDLLLELDAFEGTGTGADELRGAMTSIDAFLTLHTASGGAHRTNLVKFAS